MKTMRMTNDRQKKDYKYVHDRQGNRRTYGNKFVTLDDHNAALSGISLQSGRSSVRPSVYSVAALWAAFSVATAAALQLR